MQPLAEIVVPTPKPKQIYSLVYFDKNYQFTGLNDLLAKADYSKAGDRGAGIAAKSEVEREAARTVLSSLTIEHIYENPLLAAGEVDEVMHVNYAIDLEAYNHIKHLSLGELKDILLVSDGIEIKKLSSALTGVMVAALAKLCDTHELVFIASKLENKSQARTQIGSKGVLSSRLQPNHPTDDFNGISALIYTGLALGAGDALIGVNPAHDNRQTISDIYFLLDDIRRKTGAPTQICVLSHIKTVLHCLDAGAPVEILFQSLAGTEATNLTEFDISVSALDSAHEKIHRLSPLIKENPQARCMYFETGQGSEYSYNKHNDIDMTTCEALCYGLARRYQPFMVNNVTGFIGPETHADNFEMIMANLQDHFMGKLMGLPMGMAPCYTLHSNISLEGQQIATQLLTAAGANFFMDVHLNTDRMLAYFDTSAHDDQTLRELYQRRPTPEFEKWAVNKGIFKLDEHKNLSRGPRYGDPTVFISVADFNSLRESTPIMPKLQLAGPRPINAISRSIKLDQAFARDAIYNELDIAALSSQFDIRILQTLAGNKLDYLNNPELGSKLSDLSARELRPENKQVQIVISDGLSANAVSANCATLLEVVLDGLAAHDIDAGKTIVVPFGRVKLAEDIAERLNAEIILYFIGERPGGTAEASRSLSCYYIYNLNTQSARSQAIEFSGNLNIQFEYSVLSNIYEKGINPIEAGSVIVDQALTMQRLQAAGNRLESLTK